MQGQFAELAANLHRTQTAQTPTEVMDSLYSSLQLLLPAASIDLILPINDTEISGWSTLQQTAYRSGQPQQSEDGCHLIVPLLAVAEDIPRALLTASQAAAFTIQEVALLITAGGMAANRLSYMNWALPPFLYRQIVDNANVAIDVVDNDDKLVYMNEAGLQLYNYSRLDTLLGKPIRQLFHKNIGDTEQLSLDQEFDATDRFSRDFTQVDANGQEMPLHLFVFALRNPNTGEITHRGAVKLNLQEQYALLDSLEQQARRLHAAAEVSRLAITHQETDSMLKMVGSLTLNLFGYEVVTLSLIEGDRLVLKALFTRTGGNMSGHPRRDFPIDDSSLAGWVARHGEPLLIDDISLEPRFRPVPEIPSIGSSVVIPLRIGGRVIGAMNLGSAQKHAFTGGDVETFQGIADQLAVAIENMRLLSAERRRVQELSVVNEISRLLVASSYDIEPLWAQIYEQIRSLFNVSTFYVMLYDTATDSLRFRYLVDMGKEISFNQSIPVTGLSAMVIRTGKPARIDDLYTQQGKLSEMGVAPLRFNNDQGYTRSWLGVPLRARDDSILGLISIQSYEPAMFKESDERLLSTVAAQISLALENTRLFVRLSYTASKLEQRTRRLEELSRLGTLLSSSLDRNVILTKAAEQIVAMMDVDHCGIVILHPSSDYGVVVAESPAHNTLGTQIPFKGNPIYEMHKAQDVVLYDTSVETGQLRDILISQGVHAMLVMRMMGKDRLLGSIGLDMMEHRREFTEEDLDIFRIIVTQVALAVENADLYSKALAANDLKSQFLATMSHELRTPMNAIIGYTEMVLTGLYGSLTDKQRDRLQRVYTNGKTLLDLINDVLDLSKIESGHMRMDVEQTDIVPLVIAAIGNIAPIAEAKKLRISIEIPEGAMFIPADPMRFRQIMLNLLSNAVKFTREGGITISINTIRKQGSQRPPEMPAAAEMADGEYLAVAVQDTGIGIEPENFEVIFDAFRQVDGSTMREYQGTGLGLSITRQLVEMHRGQIWVKSEVGKGSTFTVVLPMH
ncbi:MAG: GAF domain-containing protein [Anaerolineae bacterium]|nr:GAF domain-containing protein [Anaerolineae bacterium]